MEVEGKATHGTMKEIWKDIKGFDGRYQVSSFGNVRSKNQMLSPGAAKSGYLTVSLGGKSYTVHRLVASAFIPNPNNLPQVDHKNTDRRDNRVENLHWVTAFENMQNPVSRKNMRHPKSVPVSDELRRIRSFNSSGERHPFYGKKHSDESKNLMSKSHSKPVAQYDLQGSFVNSYPSAKEAQKETGIFASAITACCRGKQKQSRGYIWRYLT